MNREYLIYQLSDEDRKALTEGATDEAASEAKAKFDELREDVARLDGYLKGRADSDKPKLDRPNSDLTHRRTVAA